MGAGEQLILEIVCKVETGKLTRPEGQKLLQVSARTLLRYLRDYREKGIGFVRHNMLHATKPLSGWRVCTHVQAKKGLCHLGWLLV